MEPYKAGTPDREIFGCRADLTQGRPMTIAARFGQAKIVELLFRLRADPNDADCLSGRNALHVAARRDHVKVVEPLLHHTDTEPDVDSMFGMTALATVAAFDSLSLVERLALVSDRGVSSSRRWTGKDVIYTNWSRERTWQCTTP